MVEQKGFEPSRMHWTLDSAPQRDLLEPAPADPGRGTRLRIGGYGRLYEVNRSSTACYRSDFKALPSLYGNSQPKIEPPGSPRGN